MRMSVFDPRRRTASKTGPVTSQWIAAIAACAAIVVASLASVVAGFNYWLVLLLVAPVTYAVTYWLVLRRDGGTRV